MTKNNIKNEVANPWRRTFSWKKSAGNDAIYIAVNPRSFSDKSELMQITEIHTISKES